MWARKCAAGKKKTQNTTPIKQCQPGYAAAHCAQTRSSICEYIVYVYVHSFSLTTHANTDMYILFFLSWGVHNRLGTIYMIGLEPSDPAH